MRNLLFLFTLCLFTNLLNAQTIYVDVDATGTNAGTSWTNAYTDLQDAIDDTNAATFEIWVATGTYLPTVEFDADAGGGNNPREKTFYINKDIQLYGGFDGTETLLAERDRKKNPTILSGDIGILNDDTDNTFHVVIIDGGSATGIVSSACVLDGFSIQEGRALQNGGGTHFYAGGLYMVALSAGQEASPTILNCIFSDNSASFGGAIFSRTTDGICSPTLTNCSFYDNSAGGGGAIYNGISATASSMKLTNCSFYNNTAGAFFGGAIINDGSAGGNLTKIENCIFWNNGDDVYAGQANNTSINFSLINACPANVTCDANTIIGTDPLFIDATANNLRLQNTSPALNNGNNAATSLVGIDTDLDGNNRTINTTVDMGAYENTCPLTASKVYVNQANTSVQDGNSWATAYRDLQDGIDQACACPNSTEIWVAAGTYLPTQEFDNSGGINAREKTFYINKDIQIYGGFDGTETQLSERNLANNPTILSGDIGTVGDDTDNAYHVVIMDGTSAVGNITTACILDGFQVINGNANGGGVPHNYAGGIYNNGQGATNESSPSIVNCSFYNNTATISGGAIWNSGFEGGVSSPIITNCSFSNNMASSLGGAIYNRGTSSGGVCSPIITNCSFSNNTANSDGGAITNLSSTDVFIENCIFWGNTSTNGENEIADNNSSGTTALFSIIEGALFGAMNTDPLFVDAPNNNLRLQNNSPAINAGNNSATGLSGITTDLDGNNRIINPTVDMGAYENTTCPEGRVYVNILAPPNGDGLSWGNAFTNLQDGINQACDCGNEVWVAAGTYLPTADNPASTDNTTRDVTFYINKNIKIYGGFAGGETLLAERNGGATILSGDIDNTPNDSTGNALHIMYIDGRINAITPTDCIIDGFTFEKGNANGVFPNERGGALYNNGEIGGTSSPQLTNCSFSNNTASANGGALYNYGFNGTCSPQLTNCSFSNNTASANGGALYNHGQFGTSSPQLTNCSFSNNTAFVSGGAIRNFYTSNVQIENCIFWGNTSTNGENEIANNVNSTGTTLNYSIIDDSTPDGTVTLPTGITGSNNLDTDPLFVDASNNNLRLQNNSPAINAGNNNATGLSGITTDLDGNNRTINTTVDMGAYESTCPEGRVYVNILAPPNGDGLSWGNAFTNLQDGINQACDCGNEVWVAAGTYLPTVEFDADASTGSNVREKTFYINKDIQIYGGFDGTETQLSERNLANNPTILSGDIGTVGDDTDNAYHVVIMDGTSAVGNITTACILDGFQVINGNANGGGVPHNYAGGIYNNGQGATNESSPSIVNCSFYNNTATISGGAIWNSGFEGGVSSPIITNCSFSNNMASSLGGAIYNRGTSSGGVCSPIITNCSFSNNTANSDGGAITNLSSTDVFIENCIFWGNTSTNGENEIADNNSSGTTALFSIIEGALFGAMNTDPLFVDAPNNNLRLQNNSPAINAGNNSATGLSGITTDLDGNNRIINPTVDMGAYENTTCPEGRVYVNILAPPNGDGLSWGNAFTNLQDGINQACDCGNEVWVAAGTYLPTVEYDGDGSGGIDVREKTFYINKNIKIYGGFAGGETLLAERNGGTTILSGDIDNTPNDSTGNAYHVMYIDGRINAITPTDCIIDGFTFEKGNANGVFPNERGGALYNDGSNGGTSSPQLTNCSFSNNTATSAAGALFNNGEIGTSSPQLTNCSFSNNTASFGGALYNTGEIGTSSPQLTNCSFSNNTASTRGGAIRNFNTTNVQIENCIFWGNTSTNGENEIANSSNSTGTTLNYSIIDDSTPDGTVTLPTGITGSNNLDTDPLFVDASNNNLRLQNTSLAINAGNNNATGLSGITTDLDGNDRIINTTVDMGAYESTCPEGRVYVNILAPPNGDGLSWGNAFTNLQDGINQACDCGNEVWVAAGTYLPTQEFDADVSGGIDVREKTFYINKNIKIYGGFAGGETLLAERNGGTTILSGDIDNTPNDSTGNAYHIMYIDGTTNAITPTDCIIDGFTFEKGNANGVIPNNRGGALYNDGWNGTSSPQLTNCSFSNNTASASGGALYNNAGNGGTSSPQLTNCSFSNNTASLFGGALYNHGNGGTSSPQLTNCSFSNNTASSNGGAIRNWNTSNAQIENCIFWGNTSTNGENEIAESNNSSGTTASFSIIEGGLFGATNTDPFFIDAPNNNLRLQNTSPAINAGNNSATGLSGITTDLDGNDRIIDATVDMGAYENVCGLAIRVYVNAAATIGGDGTSWATAFIDLQDGINLASSCGSEIWVAAGTYLPAQEFDADGLGGSDVREKTFYINQNIQIYGGFVGTETMLSQRDWSTNVTTLSGDIGISNDDSDNAYHVVYMDGTTAAGTITTITILDGFNIVKGNASSGSNFLNRRGGGIYNNGEGSGKECSPSILNCSFSNNFTSGNGGAIYNNGSSSGTSSPKLTNCSFSNNVANSRGGAIYNTGTPGTSSPKLTNCSFSNNVAGSEGGAIRNWYTTNVQIENCIFWNNGDEIADNLANGTTMNYSLIDDGTIDGTVNLPSNVTGANNIDIDPLFIDAPNGDLHLQGCSPAIDMGTATGAPSTDLDGNSRPIHAGYDIGAYEYQGAVITDITCYVDMDGDGYGDANSTLMACTTCPGGWVINNTDCDDTDEYVFMVQDWYIDGDGDGYGASSITQCARPTDGFLLSELAAGSTGTDDCDDNNPNDVTIAVDDNPILPDLYFANNLITSIGTVTVGTVGIDKVTFQAGKDIILSPGFVAAVGSDFQALIDSDCSTPPAPLVQEETDHEATTLAEIIKEESEAATPAKNLQAASLTVFPNPTRSKTNIAFTIPESGNNSLAVYNNTGTVVKILASNQWMEQGEYLEELETEQLPAGIYVIVLHTNNSTITKKLIVID